MEQEKIMKIYHVKTQQAYDELMSELEGKGYEWLSGYKPTEYNYWEENKEDSCINILGKYIGFMNIERSKNQYPNIPIIEYKAKGESVTQEEMKQNIFDWARDVSVAVESFARGMYEAEADLQEAKSSAKKLIEKIDEYLESQEPKFKVGDYVALHAFNKEVAKIEKIYGDKLHGLWYNTKSKNIEQDYYFGSGTAVKHATPTEISEYEAALIFYKHGRNPFEVKKGDILRDDKGTLLFVDTPSVWKKEYFTSGRYTFLKTVEEYNEWLHVDDELLGADDEN